MHTAVKLPPLSRQRTVRSPLPHHSFVLRGIFRGNLCVLRSEGRGDMLKDKMLVLKKEGRVN